jgi:hypothetical protein
MDQDNLHIAETGSGEAGLKRDWGSGTKRGRSFNALEQFFT